MISSFRETVRSINPQFLDFQRVETLQANLGNMCNQYCAHCHIEAGPTGNKIMSKEVMEKIIRFLQRRKGLILDITGGCPELNPDFKFLIDEAHGLTSRLTVRTNLTILLEKGMEWIPDWYRDCQVVLMASLPCYTEENVDKQRGNGVFERSIKAIKRLNELGYGDFMELNLVYNPGDDFLPGSQEELELDYKRELLDNYGIKFNKLLTITNAPLGRFRKNLKANGRLERYVQLLVDNFNDDAAADIMCRTLMSVSWQGILYNCDFNQAAGLPVRDAAGKVLEIDDIEDAIHEGYEIVMANHCYCCTAGAGSSCTGALV